MELAFVNGSDLQKAACRTAAHNLLNLPFDAIPLTLTIEFVADPLASEHNEFAATTWTYNSTSATIKIASIAPNWPEPWKGVQFLQEVFAHELGHALFAALPKASRVAIAQLHGASSDGLSEINPSGAEWEDRYIEGIAETFKDAFLPRRFRRHPNRTNRRLSISRYPELRALWRSGVESLGGFGPNANLVGGGRSFDAVEPLFGTTEGRGLFDYEEFSWTLEEDDARVYSASAGAWWELPLSVLLSASTGMWAPEEVFFLPPPSANRAKWHARVEVRILKDGFIWRRIEDFRLETFDDGEGGFIIRRPFEGGTAPAGAAVQRTRSKLEGLKIIKQESQLVSSFGPGDAASFYGGTVASILEEIADTLEESISFDPDEVLKVESRAEVEHRGNFDAAGMTLDVLTENEIMLGPGLGVHPLFVGEAPLVPIEVATGTVGSGGIGGGRVRSPYPVRGG